MICKRENSAENSEDDPDHCMWDEFETTFPAQHTPMEHHHLHGCIDYNTRRPKSPRETLKHKWGLDIKGGHSGAGTGTAAGSTEHNSSSNHPNRQPLSTSSNNRASYTI
jgi:hypothetical protein